jgi:hypothetical protein
MGVLPRGLSVGEGHVGSNAELNEAAAAAAAMQSSDWVIRCDVAKE